MGKFILRRLGISVVILLLVVFVIYALLRCLPASYVETMALQLSQTPGAKPYEQWVQELNSRYGLDVGIVPGYFVQLRNLLTGNLGDSWKYAVPVWEKFSQVIGVSLIMLLFAFTKKKTDRLEGATSTMIYVAYTAYIIMRAFHIWIF